MNEQFGRKKNEDVNGNRKLFWKEVRHRVTRCVLLRRFCPFLGLDVLRYK